MKLHEELARMVDQRVKAQLIVGEASAVNLQDYTCTVTPVDGGAPYTGVRLKVNIEAGEKGAVEIPKDKTTVVMALLDKSDSKGFLVSCNELQGWFVMAEEVKLNGDGFGGLIKNEDLEDNLNQLKTYSETLKTVIASILDGLLPGSGTTIDQGMQAVAVSFKEMENPKVKHG